MGINRKNKIIVAVILILIITAIVFMTKPIVEKNVLTNAAQYEVANTSTTADGKFEYTELFDGTIEITKYVGTDTVVTIPSTIEEKNVTSIGSQAFWCRSNLTEITIPEGIIKIGSYAFYGCFDLKEITIPETVESIGNFAFHGCKFTEITIPKGVTSIGDAIFSNCIKLTNINVDLNNAQYMSNGGVLFNKTQTEIICYPQAKKSTKYDIPEEVTSIGNYAFKECGSLTNIAIPEGVTNIGNHAFDQCSSLTEITIPEGVTRIEDFAFNYCGSLTEITIPKGVTNIGEYAFSQCSSLTEITIPEEVMNIQQGAFSYCTSLTQIAIPEKVVSIGSRVFRACTTLANIDVNPNNKFYMSDDGVLFNKAQTKIVCYPKGKQTTKYDIPEGVTIIEDYTFDYCESLREITIPEGVINIGNEAFFGCYGLTKITVPKEVKTIGTEAFVGCNSLTMYCRSNSVAETYAKTNNISYIIDDEAPTIDSITKNMEEWIKENVVLTINGAKDNLLELSNMKYSFDGGATWQTQNTKTYEINTNEIMIKVKDVLGNIYTHEIMHITNIDKTSPVAGTLTMKLKNSTGSDYTNDTWTNEYVYISVNNGDDSESGHKSTTYKVNGGMETIQSQTLTKAGIYEIVVTTTDNAGNTAINTYTIKIGGLDITSNKYKIENTYISKIQEKTTVKAFKENLQTNATEIKVYSKEGEEKEETTAIATGMKVELKYLNQTKIFTLVVTGDVDGNGEVKFSDMTIINRYRLNKRTLEGEFFLAGDVNEDGKVDFKDLVKINRFRLHKITEL